MGYGFRVFLVEEDNSIKMIPTAKFDRLWQPESNDQWQPYANKSIRYAKVVLNLTDRKPLSILHVDYGYLVFDSEGKLDQKIIEEEIINEPVDKDDGDQEQEIDFGLDN